MNIPPAHGWEGRDLTSGTVVSCRDVVLNLFFKVPAPLAIALCILQCVGAIGSCTDRSQKTMLILYVTWVFACST